ncbi:MAG: acyltransferase family protein, partial [Bacteroidota bacterium]
MRRHDLDWMRIGAFTLLIFYHIGMYYVPWDFHVKNEPTYTWLEIPMLFINQWRLPLLFLIAGMGAHFSLVRRTGLQFISERFVRLLVPLAFGMLVIVPPQVYVERVLEGDFTGSFWAFYPDYFVGIYPTGNFSWHHLWFLPYLFVYALLLCPLFVYCKKHPDNALRTFFSKLIQSKVGLLLLSLPLILTHLFLRRLFPVTHNLVYDWYNFIYLLLFFFYGYLFVSVGQVFWKNIATNKKI